MRRRISTVLPPSLLLALLVFPPAGAGHAGGPEPAAAAVDAQTVEAALALMPGATRAFARRFERPLLRAAADSAGRFILVLGGTSITVVGIDPGGDVLWEHRLGTWSNPTRLPYPGFLAAASNGSALIVLGRDEDRGRHLVIAPGGGIACDEILDYPGDGGPALGLSPGGRYFYARRQGAHEVELTRVSGGRRRISLPPLDPDRIPLANDPTEVTIVSPDQVLATTLLEGGALRRVLIDLAADPPLGVDLETPATADWRHGTGRQGADTVDGGLLVYEAWDRSANAHIASYGRDGQLQWRTPVARGAWRLIAARDRPLAALFAPNCYLKTLDTRTGRILDSAAVWRDLCDWWIGWTYEQWFEEGRLLMAVHGGPSGNEQAVVEVEIDAQGRIGPGALREQWVWGLGREQPVFGIAERCFADSVCTIVGFRKQGR